MKFSEKMCLLIILKVTKIQGFTLSLENTSFEKPQEGGDKIDPPPPPPSPFRVKDNILAADLVEMESLSSFNCSV